MEGIHPNDVGMDCSVGIGDAIANIGSGFIPT
jgi:hypothetical protein